MTMDQAIRESPLAVQARSLYVTLGDHTVLEDITVSIPSGLMVGVVGPNGAGKTTLLRVLLGLIKTYDGDIRVFDTPPHRLGRSRHTIGYVPQKKHFDRRFPISVLDVVMMGRVSCRGMGRFFTPYDREQALKSLALVDAIHLKDRPIGELSGGQQQRVFLARALCSHTKLLLLDEPNTGLDVPSQEQFFDLLRRFNEEQGLTVIVVSHDLDMIGRYAHRLLCINRRLRIDGPPADVLNSIPLSEAYAGSFHRPASISGRERI